MTKIVYNACYGGFGLSHEAVMRYNELAGLNLKAVRNDRFSSIIDYTYYVDGIEDDKHHWYDGDIKDRTDPHLVQVVEELGKKANGPYSNLRIVDVPAGTKYRIDEYDGRETVMTANDYEWSIA